MVFLIIKCIVQMTSKMLLLLLDVLFKYSFSLTIIIYILFNYSIKYLSYPGVVQNLRLFKMTRYISEGYHTYIKGVNLSRYEMGKKLIPFL